LEDALAEGPFLCGQTLSLADISLAAYTRMAGDGGFALADYPKLQAWIARVEGELGL
jgi:glutathione S-transferase